MREFLVSLSFFSLFTAAQPLTVAAASDLAPLEFALKQAFRQPVVFSFGSSGMLARQIRQGAPFDLFLSANEAYVRELSEAGIVDPATVRTYARGRLGLYGASSLEELGEPRIRHIAIPNPRHAPYGVAAEMALRRAGIYDRVKSKLLYGENVRQTFEYARSGNADACLTAWTLLKDNRGVPIPEKLHEPVLQSGGVVRSSAHAAQARALLDFLTSPAGRALLARFGL